MADQTWDHFSVDEKLNFLKEALEEHKKKTNVQLLSHDDGITKAFREIDDLSAKIEGIQKKTEY